MTQEIEKLKRINETVKKNTDKLNLGKIYGNWVLDDTKRYQKRYGFEIETGKEATHNNEADAFKHAFMQAQLTLFAGKHAAATAGFFHEWQGNKNQGQPKSEENMDNWNNLQGREIANEILKEFHLQYVGHMGSSAFMDKIKDIIASKVIERMQAGKLILDPSGRRMPRHKLIKHSSNKKGCAGTYHVNGYKRADGTEVSDYYRTCGARHKSLDGVDIRFATEKLSDDEIKAGRAKYADKRYQDLTRAEQLDAIKYFV